MATVTVLLKKNKPGADGSLPVYLRISDGDGHRFLSLGVRVPPSKWDEAKGRVRKSYKEAEEINAHISKRLSEVESEMLRRKWSGDEASAAELKAAVDSADTAGDVFAYATAWSEDLTRQGRIYYRKRIDSVMNKLKEFTGSPLPFERLTPKLLQRYQAHLLGKLKNSPNTAVVNFSIIRTLVRRAVKEGILEPGMNPFLRFSPVKQTKPSRTKLTVEEIKRIENLKLPRGSVTDVTRDAFLFSLYCAGIRFGDLARLRWSAIVPDGDDERLDYRMSKTGARKSVRLVPKAAKILKKYRPKGEADPDAFVFPLLDGYDITTPEDTVRAISSRNVVVNAELKEIATKAKIHRAVSFHVSRHSFADLARRRGADVYKISQALGHSNLKVTQTYLAGFDDGAADEVVGDVINW